MVTSNNPGPYEKAARKANSFSGIVGATIKGLPAAALSKIPGAAAVGSIGTAAARMKSHNDQIIGSFKKGGKVKKTGNYKLHKGEKVVPVKKVKKGKSFNGGAFESARKKYFGLSRKRS